jgi:hypothetical protein
MYDGRGVSSEEIKMKALRILLMLGGSALVVWGVVDYFGAFIDQTDQAAPKVILGLLAILGSIFTKNRRS